MNGILYNSKVIRHKFMKISRRFLSSARQTLKKDVTVYDKDRVHLSLKAGTGGEGIVRFNGVGGNGGSIFILASKQIDHRKFFQGLTLHSTHLKAENGEHSRQIKLAGRHGKDRIVNVPLGVEVTTLKNILIAQCTTNRKMYLLARGGQGGCADNNYHGQKGDECSVYVHLKLRPNIGIVGFPNAGKSTLLKALVPEKSIEVSSTQFTTKHPQVCYVKFDGEEAKLRSNGCKTEGIGIDTITTTESVSAAPQTTREREEKQIHDSLLAADFSLSIADLPGIIEGASRNIGGGLNFLKHLEYSDIIAMVVDVQGFQLAATPEAPFRTALETIALLNREIEGYKKGLVRRPFILLINKIDIGDGAQMAQELCELFINDAEDGKWIEHVRMELRPHYPIRFKSVHAICAKHNQLGNFKEIAKQIYLKRNPPQHLNLVEEKDVRRKQNVLI